MAQVHFVSPPYEKIFGASFTSVLNNQVAIGIDKATFDPMVDIATFASNWSITFTQVNLSLSSLWTFVNMTHFLDFLRTLEGDIFLQKSDYSSDYNISFTTANDYTEFTKELSDRSRLRILFSNDKIWLEASQWLKTEYADERDFSSRNRYITCRDAELAAMVRLRYSPDCD